MNKMLACVPDSENAFRVVRVETTKPSASSFAIDEDETVDELEDEAPTADFVECGQGVAHEMKNVGSSILRGSVIRRHEDGKWVVGFSDGRKFKMTEFQVKAARQLFQKEVASLVSTGMARVDASNVHDKSVETSSKKKALKPILAEGTAETVEEYERLFEEVYEGAVPDTIVGIEFSNTEVMEDGLILWESVLRNLARKLLLEGAKPLHQLQDDDVVETIDL